MLALLVACAGGPPRFEGLRGPLRTEAATEPAADDSDSMGDDSSEQDTGAEEAEGGDTGGDPGHGPTLIIGGGPAGMAAAMDLDRVILFEASSVLGGRAPGIGQVMWFVGTAEQERQGVVDSPEQALSDWSSFTGSEPTAATEAFVGECSEVYDRLVDLGLSFVLSDAEPMLGRRRNHGALAPGLTVSLWDGLPDELDVRLDTPVIGLLIEDGRVVGVETEAGRVYGERVIIASGGFAARADLVGAHVLWAPGRWRPSGDDFAQGDALDWAAEHHLGTAGLSDMGALVSAIGLPGSDGFAVDISAPGGPVWIFVNTEGQRFTAENQTFSLVVAGRIQAEEPAWQLMTRENIAARLPLGEEAVLDEVICGSTWLDLAAEIGVSPAGLEETLQALTSAERSNLEGTPCAFPPGFAAAKGFGGLAVDEQQRVLGLSGEPVKGLYAIGEAAGMAVPGLGGRYGFDGSLSAVVWSGWRVAETINAELAR